VLSFQDGSWTWSGRIEAFHIGENDGSAGELNTQNGYALTLAALRDRSNWRIGAELLISDITRPGNIEIRPEQDRALQSV
jgi:hypothetical protein